MAPLMLLFMNHMYNDQKINILVHTLSLVLFAFSFFGLRGQWFISDTQYMKAMIPHHSSAIHTSQNASLEQPEVVTLSEEIIEAQVEEIEEMKQLLD